MKVEWSSVALSDIARLHAFLLPVNKRAADGLVDDLYAAGFSLADMPTRGTRMERDDVREVRKLVTGSCVIMYEVRSEAVSIVRVFHGRETR